MLVLKLTDPNAAVTPNTGRATLYISDEQILSIKQADGNTQLLTFTDPVFFGNAQVDGNLLVTGTLTANISGNIVDIGSNILPDANGAYDIGSDTLRWRKLWVNDVDVTGNVVTLNVTAGDTVTANSFVGTISTASQPNITEVGTLLSLTVSGNTLLNNLTISGTSNLVGNVSVVNLAATGNITGNISGTFVSPGTNQQVMYNDNGFVNGDQGLTYDEATKRLTAYNLTVTGETDLGSVANLTITGGNTNWVLATDGAGNLSWIPGGESLSNGNASVSTYAANSNVVIGGNLVPTSNVTQDLGAPTRAWRDLYLAGNTIYLGGAQISAEGNTVTITNPSGGELIIDGNTIVDSASIANGTSNVHVVRDGDVVFDVAGVADVARVTSTGITVANRVTTPTVTGTTTLTLAGAVGNNSVILAPTGTGTVNASAKRITNVATPTELTDAATKLYVDEVAQGLDIKQPVALATAEALAGYTYNNGASGVGATLTATANGELTVDGTVPAPGDRILVKNETGAAQAYQGIYVVTQVGDVSNPWILTRATDMDTAIEVSGAYTFVQSGVINQNSSWVCVTQPPITIGTTELEIVQFSVAGQYTAGDGLTLTGAQFSVNVDNETTAIVGGNVVVKASANLVTPNIGAATGNSLTLAGPGTVTAATANATTVNATTVNAAGTTTTLDLSVGNGAGITGNLSAGNISTVGLVQAGNVVGTVGTLGAFQFTSNIVNAPGDMQITNTGTVGNIQVTSTRDFTLDAAEDVELLALEDIRLFAGSNVVVITDQDTLPKEFRFNIDGSFTVPRTLVANNITSNNALNAVTGNFSGNLVANNITSNNLVSVSTAEVTGNLLANSITSNTTVAATTVTATGNVEGNNLVSNNDVTTVSVTASGNVTADNFFGNTVQGANNAYLSLRGPNDVRLASDLGSTELWAGTNVTIKTNLGGSDHNFLFSNAGVFAAPGDITAAANITANNITGNGIISANSITSNTSVAAATVSATGNITGANITSNGALQSATLVTTGDATVGGNLAVNGNITYINVEELSVEDPVISVGTGVNGDPLTSNDGKDRGVNLVHFDTSANAQQSAFVGYQNSTGEIIAAANVTISNEIVTVVDWGVLRAGEAHLDAANVTGNVTASNFIGNLANGNSGISIPTSNGNIYVGVNNVGSTEFTANGINTLTLAALANITAANNISGANVTASATVTANSVVANTVAGSLTTNAQPNVTSVGTLTSLAVTGNANVGGILTDNYYYANGQPLDFEQPAGANTELQFNLDGDFGASSRLRFDSDANVLTVDGNISVEAVLADSVYTDNYYYANGAPVDFQQPAGSNTQVQYNLDSDFGASANFTFDPATSVLNVIGNIEATYIYGDQLESNVFTTTTANVLGNLTANLATANAFNSLATPNSRLVYIDNNRTDTYNENGSATQPFKTIAAAVAWANSNVSSSVPVSFVLSNGTYAETIDLNNTALSNITFVALGRVAINPASGNALQAVTGVSGVLQMTFRNLEFGKPVVITGDGTSQQFNNVTWVDCSFGDAFTATTINNMAFWSCSAFAAIKFTNVNYVLYNSGQMLTTLTLEATDSVTLPANGMAPGIVLMFNVIGNDVALIKGTGTPFIVWQPHNCRFGRTTGTYTVPATFNVTAYNSTLNGTWINDGTLSLRNSSTANPVGNLGAAYSGIIGGTSVVGSLSTAAQPNVTSVGNLTSLTVVGNLTAGNIDGGNLVSANYLSGNYISGNIVIGGANTEVLFNDDGVAAGNASFTFDKVANLMTVTGTIATETVTSNSVSANTVTAVDVDGTLGANSNSQPNITSVGTLVDLSVTGNISTANYFVGNGFYLTDITTESISNGNYVLQVTSDGSAEFFDTDANTQLALISPLGANGLTISGANAVVLSADGTEFVFANTGTATLPNLSVTGDSLLGNLATANYFEGTLAANSNSQPNITAVGNLVSLNVDGVSNLAGNVNTGNLEVTGNVQINGELNVDGNITYIDITNLRVSDPIISLGTGPNGDPLTSNDGKDRGSLFVHYDTGAAAQQTAFVGWKNSTGNIILAGNVTNTDEIITVVDWGNVELGNVSAVGTATANLIAANTANITGNIIAANVTANVLLTTVAANVSGTATIANVQATTGRIGNYRFNGDTLTTANLAAGPTIITNVDGNAYDLRINSGYNLTLTSVNDIVANANVGFTVNAPSGPVTINGDVLRLRSVADAQIRVDNGGANLVFDFSRQGNLTVPNNAFINNTANISNNLNVSNNVVVTNDVRANTVTLGNATITVNTVTWNQTGVTGTSPTVIMSVPTANVSRVDFNVIGTSDIAGGRQSAKVVALVYNGNVSYNEYETLVVGNQLGEFDVNVVGSNLELSVTQATADSGIYKITATVYY